MESEEEEDEAGMVFEADGRVGSVGQLGGFDQAALSEGTQGRPPKGNERMLRVYFCSSGMVWWMKHWRMRSTTVKR